MKKLRWQILIVTLAIIAIGILLISQQPVLEEAAPIKPTSGGLYSEALIGSLGRLNPALDYYNAVDRDINRLLYSGLIKFDDRGLPQGDLCESWGISQDGTVYNFSIRSNAIWHDGQPVTSQDVIFTIELLRSDNIPLPEDLKSFWKQIEIKELDNKTLQFRLPESFAPFLDYLTFGILPKHLLSGIDPATLMDHPFNLNPIGTGPYRFENMVAEGDLVTSIVLSAFEKFYIERPYIDQVVFRYYPEARAALNAYHQGDVLGISQITDEILIEVLNEPALNIYTGRLPNLSLIYLNLDDPQLPFFQEPSLRKALLMSLNRQQMVDRLLNSQAIVADGPVFPGTWAYYDNIEHVEYNPEKALSALKENGYTIPAEGGNVRAKEGVLLSFELIFPDAPPFPLIAESIQRDWTKLGIEVKLKAMPFEELLSAHLDTRNYQAALVALNLSRSPDPDPYPFWDQAQVSQGQNYAKWNDRQASEFLEQARINVDLGERTKAYRNFQVRFTTEMPALPLFYPVYNYAVDEQVQNIRIGSFFDASDRFNNFATWYLVAKRPLVIEPLLTPTP